MSDTPCPLRPISELTHAMGMVLLIGESGYMRTPTRCAIGYRSESGQVLTFDGDHFTEGGSQATSFMEGIPYDQDEALRYARGDAATGVR